MIITGTAEKAQNNHRYYKKISMAHAEVISNTEGNYRIQKYKISAALAHGVFRDIDNTQLQQFTCS